MDLPGVFVTSIIASILIFGLFCQLCEKSQDRNILNESRCYIITLLCIYIPLCYMSYLQALDRKNIAIDLENELAKPYQCQYEFINMVYCVDINCQIYTFNLYSSEFEVGKKFTIQCDRRDTCHQFSDTNMIMTCYLPNDINTITYIRPEVGYFDPTNLYVMFIIYCCLLGIYIIIEISICCITSYTESGENMEETEGELELDTIEEEGV